MSVMKIRILSLIPYSFGYAFILVCTALGIAFFLWFLIGEINVRGETFDIGRRALNLPSAVVKDARGLVNVVPEFMNSFQDLINDVTSFSTAMGQIESLLNTTKSNINGVMGHLDNNAQAFNKVKNRQLSMVSRANGTMGAVNFDAFDNVFRAANVSISSGVTSGFDSFNSAINSGLSGVQSAVAGINTQISAMNNSIAGQLNTMVDQMDTLIQPVRDSYEKYVSQDSLNDYEGYVRIAEAVFGVVIILVITVVVALMTCGFLCVFLRLWPCLKCLDCCASLCIIAYAIVGTICLVLWCLSEDICSQAEGYLGKVENSLNLPSISVPGSNINITIKFSDAFLGVLECPEGSNFLDASKLSLDTFGIKDMIRSYEDQFKAGLSNFQVSDFLGSAVGNLSSITGGINIADNIGTRVDELKGSISTAVSGFFTNFPLQLTFDDFKYEAAQFEELNTILATVNRGPYTKANITNLAPYYYDTPTQTPGKIIAMGEGSDFDSVVALALSDADKDKIWGSLARDDMATAVVPTGTIQKSLVYNLTRMNVGSPLNVHEIYDDYQMLLIELDQLVSSVNETEKYTSGILNLQPAVDALLGTFNATYTNTLTKISQFIDDSVDMVVNRVISTEVFQCGFIGSYYSTVKKSGCGNLKTALGGTAIVSLFMVAALFIMFFIIMFADCMAFRKASKYGKGYDSDSDDDETSLDSIKKD